MQYFRIGKIIGSFGLRGDIKIYPTTDDVKRFDLLSFLSIQLNIDSDIIDYKIEQIRYHKGLVIAKLEGISEPNGANSLKNAEILINRKDALPLSDDEYYISDLIGLSVISFDNKNIGRLKSIIPTGANDVYIIDTKDSSNNSTGEILIPAIKRYIKEINIESKSILLHSLEGLI